MPPRKPKPKPKPKADLRTVCAVCVFCRRERAHDSTSWCCVSQKYGLDPVTGGHVRPVCRAVNQHAKCDHYKRDDKLAKAFEKQTGEVIR